jgi:hypothetical protein
MWTREGSTVAETLVALQTDALLLDPVDGVEGEPDELERSAAPTSPPTTPATSTIRMPTTIRTVEGRTAAEVEGVGARGGVVELNSSAA